MSKVSAFGHQTREKTTGERAWSIDCNGSTLIRRRKGHFIISDYVDKMVNKRFPNFPLDYAVST